MTIALDEAAHKPIEWRCRQHYLGLATWTGKIAAISSPPQQPQTYYQIHNKMEIILWGARSNAYVITGTISRIYCYQLVFHLQFVYIWVC